MEKHISIWFKHIVDREREKHGYRISKPNKHHYDNNDYDYHNWDFNKFISKLVFYVWNTRVTYHNLGLNSQGQKTNNHYIIDASVKLNDNNDKLFNLIVKFNRNHYCHNSSNIKKFYNYVQEFYAKDGVYTFEIILNTNESYYKLDELYFNYGVRKIEIQFDKHELKVTFYDIDYSLL